MLTMGWNQRMIKLASVVALLFGFSVQAAMADDKTSAAFKMVYVQETVKCMLLKSQMFDDKVSSAVVVGIALNQFCANAFGPIAQNIVSIDGQHSVDTLNELNKEVAVRIVLYVRANPQDASCVQCIAKAFSQQ
jgi:hypothetical protein